MTYRVTMVLTNNPKYPADEHHWLNHVTRFAGCKDADDARRKCREVFGSRLVGIKTVKEVDGA